MSDATALRLMPDFLQVPAGKLHGALQKQIDEAKRLERMGLLKLTPRQYGDQPGYRLVVSVTPLGNQVLRQEAR